MRVLAIGAHPDDVEYHCGGTLLRYKEAGHEVVIGIATNGDQGHYSIPPVELAEIRRAEAQKAAEALDAELIWLGFHDGFLGDDETTRLAFVEMIRKAKPHVILAHDPDDYHQDHRAAASLSVAASFIATLPHVDTASPPIPRTPALYTIDHSAGATFRPTDYVDVSEVFERKVALMECHASQVAWLKEHDGSDVVGDMRIVNRYRGLSCGALYAEAFRRHDAWGFMSAGRLLP
jgi:LmbE family N-acetylglucosaminyl deacetylase